MKTLNYTDYSKKQIVKHFSIITCVMLIPIWSGCTSIVTTSGKTPQKEQFETTAIKDWNLPVNMRELNEETIPVADLALKVSRFNNAPQINENTLADSQGNCPAGTVPFLSTVEGKGITQKTIRASGYGASPARLLSDMQKRLLAMRAAKLDAIRTLSERVSGIQIWGGATLSDLAIKSDKVHVRLDAFIHGARVISTNYMDDGSYETVMEINFSKTVANRLNMNRCLPADKALNMQYSSL